MKIFRAAVILFHGVEELDFVGVWQVLGTTQHLSKSKHIQIRSIGMPHELVKCAHGLTVKADEHFGDLSKFDVIIVPGGPGTQEATKDTALLNEMMRMHKLGKLMCSVCTGAFILAEAGILKGKRATTYHTEVDKLSKYGAIPVRERVVVQDNVVTGAGVCASLDVGLKITEILLGLDAAAKVAEWIEYPQ